jgi:hypothetical protein
MKQETPQVMTDRPSALYFSVSKTKLIVMSMFSWGIYEFYWFYKNWKLIKESTGQDIRPFWRTFFAPFYCYSLFKSVKQSADSHGILSEISPGWLTAAYIGIYVTHKFPDPIWLISFLSFLPLLPVQGVINQLNSKVALEYELNDHFSWKNIVVIILGGILLILLLTDIFIPE